MRNRFYKFEPLPVHLSLHCGELSWPELPLEFLWSACINHLSVLKVDYSFEPIAFVLMRNHLHLLSRAFDGCSIELSQNFAKMLEGTFWQCMEQGRVDEWLTSKAKVYEIKNFKHYLQTYKYIYTNPVRAGLAGRAEEYSYSSLNHYLSCTTRTSHPFCDNLNLITDQGRVLSWLNDGSRESTWLLDFKSWRSTFDAV